jgi:hypothetical protein
MEAEGGRIRRKANPALSQSSSLPGSPGSRLCEMEAYSRKIVVPNEKEKDEVGGNDPRQSKRTMEKDVHAILVYRCEGILDPE